MSSPWQRYKSADVTGTPGADVTAAYCPVCCPVYASSQYQRYAVPSSINNGCCRRPDLDVFRPTHHSPDLLGPLTNTTATSSTLQACSAVALRAVSCSAPDLIELSARLTVGDQEPPEQHADDRQEQRECAADSQVRCVTSFPARHVSQSTVVVCGEVSPSRERHRTINDQG